MAEWKKEQSDEFTALYKKYEQQPHYSKEKAHKELFSEQLPYNEAKGRLLNLMAGQKKETGLEAKVKESGTKNAFDSFFESVGRAISNPLVPTIATALALWYIGVPYISP
ncbi:MAG TPA: hypothetical protein VJB90_04210 [Candidatus Nanoarchaeia archaeon]|nr:hypothetical protein [Candidatus Nanoarchaeia archaeon]